MININKIKSLLEDEFPELKKKGERVKKLSEIIGRTNKTAENLLKGKCNNVEYLQKIADCFGLEVDDLLIKNS